MSPAAERRWRWHPRATDVVLIVLPVLLGLNTVFNRPEVLAPVAPWLVQLDLAAGLVACAALWWRRRFPLVVASVAVVLSTFSEVSSPAALVALFTVAIHCSVRATATVFVTNLLALGTYALVRPEPQIPLWALAGLILFGTTAVVAWGLLIRSRRQLVASLRERAAAAEVEATLRAERSQHEARETLAREMHDVLGHRLSLLSVHAGALAYAREASPEETARAAEVVRENAHRALQDLREVIGVLRAPVGEMPLPTAEDIAELVDETSRAGTTVELRDGHGVTTGERPVGETVGRTLYRFVQESLTNARKHAPGAPVVVRIGGGPDDQLVTEVENRRPPEPAGPDAHPAGSGEGLRGLAERARLVGGAVDYGPTTSGGWRTSMRLPWPA